MYLSQSINECLHNESGYFRKCKNQRAVNRRLEKIFKALNVKAKTVVDANYSKVNSYLGGSYDPDKDEITLSFFLSPKAYKVSLRKRIDMDYFIFIVSQALQHELIHRYQYSNRSITYELHDETTIFKHVSINDDIEYLLDPDEIEAHSHDIAMEIRYVYSTKCPFSILRRIHKFRKDIITYNTYYETLKNTKYWKKTKKKLLKQTYMWLPTAEIE